ncbi:hypothetical protein ISCGN_003737 [Ixodes scapularis]
MTTTSSEGSRLITRGGETGSRDEPSKERRTPWRQCAYQVAGPVGRGISDWLQCHYTAHDPARPAVDLGEPGAESRLCACGEERPPPGRGLFASEKTYKQQRQRRNDCGGLRFGRDSTLGDWVLSVLCSRVFEEVQTCCAALSERLGQQSYFFGDKPTELDALTFGHLYSLMTTDLVDGRLGQIVSGFGNLVDLCHRVESQYFADS